MSTATMDRGSLAAMAGMGTPAPGMMGTPTASPSGMGMMMVPRCAMTFEKCAGGMKIVCKCDDTTSAAMLQNLCAMMAGGMCGCCCTMNGMMVCCCNLTMGICKCEPTADGVCITCVSGDEDCCSMIQGCCECMTAMMDAGCTCCVMMNNMPVCCGC